MIAPFEAKEDKQLKLIKVKKERNLCRVFFDDKSSLLCSEDDIFNYKLYNNSKISKSNYFALKSKNDFYACLNDAIRIVNTKMYSTKQVSDRLLKLEHVKVEVEKVIEYLIEKRILDDEIYTQMYLEFKINQGYGPLYIKNKLFELGIDTDVFMSNEQQLELLNKKLVKKSGKIDSIFIKKFKTKMVNQGYNIANINKVLSTLDIEESLQSIKVDYQKFIDKYKDKYTGYKLKMFVKQKLMIKGYRLEEIEKVMEEGIYDEY